MLTLLGMLQDVSQETAARFPILYQETMSVGRAHFMLTQFKWLLFGSWHALVCYFLPMYTMTTPDRNAIPDDWYVLGASGLWSTSQVVSPC
jgi:phospholipid-translocating ATPase/phospholipid-transporting ATPase